MKPPRCVLNMAWIVWVVMAQNGRAEAPPTLDNALTFMAEMNASYKDWSGHVVQVADMGMGKFQQVGEMSMKIPSQFRMLVSMEVMGQAATNLIIAGSDGIAWTEVNMMGQKQVMKTDLKQLTANGRNPVENANPSEQIKRYQELFDLKLKDEGGSHDGQPMFFIEGTQKTDATRTAKDPQLAALLAKAKTLRMLIGKQDGFVHKIEMMTAEDKTLFSQEFSSLKFNQGLSDDLFQYNPPEGVTVMDMSKSATKSAEPKTQGAQP